MPLILDTASATEKGKRPSNADAHLAFVPDMRTTKRCAIFAVADGLDGRSDNGRAAQCAVDALNSSFYAAPPEWDNTQLLRESFDAANMAVTKEGEKNLATTLSALTLEGRRWTFGHIGDTRIYLYRNQKLKLLTHDHTEPRMNSEPVVNQACGLSKTVDIELGTGELQEDDIFLLTTDGVHDVLNGSIMMACLMKSETAEEIADAMIKQAQKAGSADDMSICVVSVDKLPDPKEAKTATVADNISALPIGPLPEPEDEIDGFKVKRTMHSGLTSVVYKCIDQQSGETVALRFPNPQFADDQEFINAFLREEWIGNQHDNPHLFKGLPIGRRKRSVLYSVVEYHRGESLTRRLRRKQKLSVRETVYLADQLLDCLEYIHNKGITHRDINPGNIFIDRENKRLLLVGFGLSSIERLQDVGAELLTYQSGKSYRAPELLQGHETDKRADIFSTGVTIYKMLTGKYPYGRVEKTTSKTYKSYRKTDRYNKKIPEWLAQVIEKACSPDPEDRYPSAAAFATALNIPIDESDQGDFQDTIRTLAYKIKPEYWQWMLLLGLTTALALLMHWLFN